MVPANASQWEIELFEWITSFFGDFILHHFNMKTLKDHYPNSLKNQQWLPIEHNLNVLPYYVYGLSAHSYLSCFYLKPETQRESKALQNQTLS